MNKAPQETSDFFEELKKIKFNNNNKLIIAPPFISLKTAIDIINLSKNQNPQNLASNIEIFAQNCHWEPSGSYTGEISADMLAEAGVEYVVIGHSERRQYFAETDLTVNRRTKAALDAGLKVILCVGEMLSEREDGITETVVELQTVADLTGVTAEQMADVIIAYEPVWAIGTGKVATDEQAEEVCAFIRKVIENKYGKAVADKTVIQYGGSMNPKNAAGLLAKENIDGGLIGGASLKAEDFRALLEATQR
jgi:triosephosphate isomerase